MGVDTAFWAAAVWAVMGAAAIAGGWLWDRRNSTGPGLRIMGAGALLLTCAGVGMMIIGFVGLAGAR